MSFKVIGHIVKAHGLKGEVQVHLDVPDTGFFCSLKKVFAGIGAAPDEVFEIKYAHIQNNKVIAAFSKLKNRDDGEKRKGLKLFVTEEEWNELQKRQPEAPDVKGWQVIDADSKRWIATAIQLLEDNRFASPLLELEHNGHLSLIPWVDEFILEVNEADRQIRVKLQEGLLSED